MWREKIAKTAALATGAPEGGKNTFRKGEKGKVFPISVNEILLAPSDSSWRSLCALQLSDPKKATTAETRSETPVCHRGTPQRFRGAGTIMRQSRGKLALDPSPLRRSAIRINKGDEKAQAVGLGFHHIAGILRRR